MNQVGAARGHADRPAAEILSRKKMGFPVPVGTWLRGPYRHLLDEYVLGDRARERGVFEPARCGRSWTARGGAGTTASGSWALVTFEMWQRIFLDGEERPPRPSPPCRPRGGRAATPIPPPCTSSGSRPSC